MVPGFSFLCVEVALEEVLQLGLHVIICKACFIDTSDHITWHFTHTFCVTSLTEHTWQCCDFNGSGQCLLKLLMFEEAGGGLPAGVAAVLVQSPWECSLVMPVENLSQIFFPPINPSAWGHLIPSSYCDVGRFFYRVFKFWAKMCRSLFKIM